MKSRRIQPRCSLGQARIISIGEKGWECTCRAGRVFFRRLKRKDLAVDVKTRERPRGGHHEAAGNSGRISSAVLHEKCGEPDHSRRRRSIIGTAGYSEMRCYERRYGWFFVFFFSRLKAST